MKKGFSFNNNPEQQNKVEKLYTILACPLCKGSIQKMESGFFCGHCLTNYPVRDGIPLFVQPVRSSETTSSSLHRIYAKIFATIPAPTYCTDSTIFDFMNKLPSDSTVLNLGSGSGLFDDRIKLPMINLDVIMNERTHIVADGHYLPFKDASIDCIFSNAVLEHVKKPWVVAAEMQRVLKPGGKVVVNLPFLNIIHDQEDYFRFTLKGIRELFPDCRELYGGVSGGGGSFLHLANLTYLRLFIPTKILGAISYFVLGHIFFRLKYLDRLVRNNPEYYLTANSFYYIGQKEDFKENKDEVFDA